MAIIYLFISFAQNGIRPTHTYTSRIQAECKIRIYHDLDTRRKGQDKNRLADLSMYKLMKMGKAAQAHLWSVE